MEIGIDVRSSRDDVKRLLTAYSDRRGIMPCLNFPTITVDVEGKEEAEARIPASRLTADDIETEWLGDPPSLLRVTLRTDLTGERIAALLEK